MNQLYAKSGPNAMAFCDAAKWRELRPGQFVRKWYGYVTVLSQRQLDGQWVSRLWHHPSHPVHYSVHGPFDTPLKAKLAALRQLKELVWEWRTAPQELDLV